MIGKTLGRYQILEQVGKGGMATVYKAYQPGLDRYVAIKILPPYFAHEPNFAQRFIREAQAIARLDHPNILPVHDFGEEGDISYIVMKYVPAGTLRDKLGQPLPPTETADIIEQIARALDFAHEQGILHRDVKPGNILIDNRNWVYLSDFGLAKMIEGSAKLTGTGVGIGTPAYMSPEQGQGLTVDARTDVYALGIILFEMLTGRVPYEADTPMAVVIMHVINPLPMPQELNPNIPEPITRVLLKALAKNRDQRFASAGEMATAFRQTVQNLGPGLATMSIPPDPEATAAHLAAQKPSTPVAPSPVMQQPIRPSPAVQPMPVPVPKKGVSWLPIALGLVGVAIGGICLVASLAYFLGNGTPPPSPTVSEQSVNNGAISVATETPAIANKPTSTATNTPTDKPTATHTPQPVNTSDTLPTNTPSPLPATSTPLPTSTPVPVSTPTSTPTLTPSPTAPKWADTGLRPTDRFADIWTTLNSSNGELGYPVTNLESDNLCARENFEQGYMLWVDRPDDTDLIWAAVVPDPAATTGNTSYKFADIWPGNPEYWCSEAEANAPLGPKRGFGMIWCTYAYLQTDIGYALDEEVGGPDVPRCTAQLFQGGAIVHNPLDFTYWVFIENGGWYQFKE